MTKDNASKNYQPDISVMQKSIETLFDMVRNQMDPSKCLKLQRHFDMRTIARSRTDFSSYSQPLQLYDKRRMWGKQFYSFCSIRRRKKFKSDPLKISQKCVLDELKEIDEPPFSLYCEVWKYIPPSKSPLNLFQCESAGDSGISSEITTLGQYESPKFDKSNKGETNALGQVSALLNLHYMKNPVKNHEIVATLVTHKIPHGLEDSLLNIDDNIKIFSTSNSDSKIGMKKPTKGKSNTLLKDKAEIDALAKSISGDYLSSHNEGFKSDSKVKQQSKGDYSSKLAKSFPNHNNKFVNSVFAIDLLEVNLHRPNIVRRRVKNSTSIAKWIEENIISEFKKNKFSEVSHANISSNINAYQSPPVENTFKPTNPLKSPSLKIGTYYNEEDLKLQHSNSIEDFIAEKQINSRVFHVYETLCKKKFSNYGIDDLCKTSRKSQRHFGSECSTESLEIEKVENDVSDGGKRNERSKKGSARKWESTEEYLDNWWKHNGKFVIFSEDAEELGYLGGSEDENPTKVKHSRRFLNESKSIGETKSVKVLDENRCKQENEYRESLDNLSLKVNFDDEDQISRETSLKEELTFENLPNEETQTLFERIDWSYIDPQGIYNYNATSSGSAQFQFNTRSNLGYYKNDMITRRVGRDECILEENKSISKSDLRNAIENLRIYTELLSGDKVSATDLREETKKGSKLLKYIGRIYYYCTLKLKLKPSTAASSLSKGKIKPCNHGPIL